MKCYDASRSCMKEYFVSHFKAVSDKLKLFQSITRYKVIMGVKICTPKKFSFIKQVFDTNKLFEGT